MPAAEAVAGNPAMLCQFLNYDAGGGRGGPPGADAAAALERKLKQGPAIRPFFDEYARGYLKKVRARSDGGGVEAVDFHALVEWSRFRNVFENAAFTGTTTTITTTYQPRGPAAVAATAAAVGGGALAPDRWTPLDHAARFVVQVLQYSWRHAASDPGAFWCGGSCDLGAADPDEDLEFWQAWLVLRYLQADWEKKHPPKCVRML